MLEEDAWSCCGLHMAHSWSCTQTLNTWANIKIKSQNYSNKPWIYGFSQKVTNLVIPYTALVPRTLDLVSVEFAIFQWALDPADQLPPHIGVCIYCSSLSPELCAFKTVVYLAFHMNFRASQFNRERWYNHTVYKQFWGNLFIFSMRKMEKALSIP